ncbi:MAG: hypothetical protein A2Z51_11700 [Deltaproteobacteria bacterium RBG_19FT_COMBO_52_11]|nr:MAG: hypothetical protein A2Z51_11700 [Deltaproteobacteria bacterium RBG_19FT_COMBO_52_11]
MACWNNGGKAIAANRKFSPAHHSIIPSFHSFNIPFFQYSSIPFFQYSSLPAFLYFNGQSPFS